MQNKILKKKKMRMRMRMKKTYLIGIKRNEITLLGISFKLIGGKKI